MDLDSEAKLISLITQLLSINESLHLTSSWNLDGRFMSRAIVVLRFVGSMDLDSEPKPESEFMSLVTQAISLYKSMDLGSQPKPLLDVIFSFIELDCIFDFVSNSLEASEMNSRDQKLFVALSLLEPEPEIISLIHRIFSHVISMNSKWVKLISLCPKAEVSLGEDKIYVVEEEEGEVIQRSKWQCLPLNWEITSFNNTHFFCRGCNGKNHQEKTQKDEIKHLFHSKRSLQLVLLKNNDQKRKCYCCDEYLEKFMYCCLACNIAINIACLEKPQVSSITRPKWHEHPLSLFSRTTSLTCDVCALADSTSIFYICAPCGFVVHRRCLDLPRVIRISRHPHRISFTPSFDEGSLSCGVCRKQMDNAYGGYSCIIEGCSYAAHSRCATQSNVWDGIELEGVPEEIEQVVEPFVRISDGIIKHFSHQHHHLKLEENKNTYDENKQCQSCTTPIDSGNFYSCLQCDFILHEECANLSRKLHHPIHPHMLTLVGGCNSLIEQRQSLCSACIWICTTGFFYKCDKEECDFKVHVQCGTISEPLIHGSHTHPLFLTSKPGEKRTCSICKLVPHFRTNETFNCIKCEFALCFRCATLPQTVRYKHDKHMLTLSYGEKTSTSASWCEVCERQMDPKKRFYTCNKDCCVTLHVTCSVGVDFYMKLGSSWLYEGKKVEVLPNNMHMSRPFCHRCMRRCPQKIVLKMSGLIFCSRMCNHLFNRDQ